MNRNSHTGDKVVVMHIFGALNRGGAELVTLDLLRELKDRDIEQHFFCWSGDRGSLASTFEAAGGSVSAIPGHPIRRLIGYMQSLNALRPDVLVSHVSLSSAVFLAAARCLGVKRRMARMHSTAGRDTQSRLYRLRQHILRYLLTLTSTEIIGVSAETLEYARPRGILTRRYRRIAHQLPNGVDLNRFSYAGRVSDRTGSPVIIHVGRNSPEKNRKLLVPIFVELERLRPTIWHVVGSEDHSDMGPINNDRFCRLGERSDVEDLLKESDVLILPSLREGQPGVIMEALASGVPVVASNLPTLRQLREELIGITLVGLEAAPSNWAESILRALQLSPLERENICRHVRSRGYGLDEVAARWLELWTR